MRMRKVGEKTEKWLKPSCFRSAKTLKRVNNIDP